MSTNTPDGLFEKFYDHFDKTLFYTQKLPSQLKICHYNDGILNQLNKHYIKSFVAK
jgi:hypothetical protein